MKIKGVIITHGELGKAIIDVADSILERKSDIECFRFEWDEDGTIIEKKIRVFLNKNKDSGIIIFTDMFGGSPANLSLRFNRPNLEIITGINLPGILKFLTYKEKKISFKELLKIVRDGARDGISIISEYLGDRKNGKREDQNNK
ncbi:MAG: PTS mannose transporter subunit IIA [Candidatus Aminicenantes bacterium]|nr:PTS mannose transporter subunit IIA [Candidatus Aminicenantes bacterium]